jgi:predicted XRE-type DNA-binding protein
MQESSEVPGTLTDTELIGELVRRIKKEGIPQEDVAKWIGVKQGRISDWVGGKRAPLREDTRLAVLRYLRSGGAAGPEATLFAAAKRLRSLAAEMEEEARATAAAEEERIERAVKSRVEKKLDEERGA